MRIKKYPFNYILFSIFCRVIGFTDNKRAHSSKSNFTIILFDVNWYQMIGFQNNQHPLFNFSAMQIITIKCLRKYPEFFRKNQILYLCNEEQQVSSGERQPFVCGIHLNIIYQNLGYLFTKPHGGFYSIILMFILNFDSSWINILLICVYWIRIPIGLLNITFSSWFNVIQEWISEFNLSKGNICMAQPNPRMKNFAGFPAFFNAYGQLF